VTPSKKLESPQGELIGLLRRYKPLLRKADPRLLTFSFHLKTGTDLFTPYLFFLFF